jgi:Pvc16 N-terminal domain/Carboxypeptidase regulatory-like domain
MLADINNTLRQLIYTRAKLEPSEVDIQFDAPTKEWVNSRTKPTVSFFLYDLEENTELRRNALEATQVRSASGGSISVKRPPPRRFNLNYMVSAISTVVEDEHHLLWRVMSALLKNPTIPDELVPDIVRQFEIPLHGRVSQPDDGPRPIDLWNSLETAPRPSLLYVLTVPVDLETEFTAPLVLTRTLRYNTQEGTFVEAQHHIGGRVVDKLGAPIAGALVVRNTTQIRTDVNGRFVLVGVPEGAVNLEVSVDGKKPRKVKLEVPADHYDVIVE